MSTRLNMALQAIKSLEARNAALAKENAELKETVKMAMYGAGAKPVEEKSKSEQRRLRIQKGEDD